jgi:cytochrome P450
MPQDALPPNVPPERIVDVDYFNDPRIKSDPRAHFLALRGGPSMVYTPRNGGHWIATRAAVMTEIFTRPDDFSSFPLLIPKSVSGPAPKPFAEMNAPDHGKYRALLMPLTNPKLIDGFETDARALLASLIDSVIASGGCDFGRDIAEKFPIFIIMRLLNLPQSDRMMLIDLTDKVINNPDPDVRKEARARTEAYVDALIAQRRANPGADIASTLVLGRIDNRPVTDKEANAMISNLIHGGLDTVRANMTFIAYFLATHPEHRRQLAKQPALIPNAVDEMLRWLSLPSIARCIVRDMDFHGVRLRAGEQVLMPLLLAGTDDQVHDDALSVRFDRPVTKSLTFGAGPHFCPGSSIARAELRIFLEEWMKRVPEFELSANASPYGSGGIVAGLRGLNLTWPTEPLT